MRAALPGLFVLCLVACEATEQPTAPVIVPEIAKARVERAEREHVAMAVPERDPVDTPVTETVAHRCEPGQTKACGVGVSLGRGRPPLAMHCKKGPDGVLRFDASDCATPLVVAFDDAPVAFTKPVGSFAVGPYARTEWVSARTPWLGLDRDGSGCIEAEEELFRFDRLAALDDDGNGRIDANDAAYARLVLWYDRDQDRRCSPHEAVGLASAGIVALDLSAAMPRETPFGSHEGAQSTLLWRAAGPGGNELRRGRLVDVYLAPLP